VANIYTSNDYGVTWNSRTTTGLNWRSASISSTGQYQLAVGGNSIIWVSVDFGNTWNAVETSRNWFDVAISSSGQYISATVNNGYIYTSNIALPAGTVDQYSYSLGRLNNVASVFTNVIIPSTYGATWSPNSSIGYWNTNRWKGVSVSADGLYQTAVSTNTGNGTIYTSSNYGVNWTARESSRDWYSVSVSSTGLYQTAVAGNTPIYTSSDYGVNWTARDISRFW
jgi:photosystem II stability/assembly factor-like uncharacterized protein